jgi:hypothetical protein
MPEQWQEIPTSAVWITASRTKFGNKRKSKEIVALDNAVAAHEQLKTRGQVSTAELSEALIKILEATEVYLASKGGKHSKNRDGAVRDLRAATRHQLAGVRWKKIRELAGGAKRGLRPMTEHVWSEMHSPDHARMQQGLPADEWLNGVENGEIRERFLFQYLRRTREALGQKVDKDSNVRYVEDEERWKYLVAFDIWGSAKQRQQISGGNLTAMGDPITTGGEPLGTSIYAMDESGNLYFQPAGQVGLNHCSFLAGRPVLCAGTVGITGGDLGYIDNGSGHYRPTRQNLINCLEKLANDIDLSRVLIRDHAGQIPMAAYNAHLFLKTRGLCTPAGYYKGEHSRYTDANNLVVFVTQREAREYIEKQLEKFDKQKLQAQVDQIATRMATSNRYEFQNDKERDIFKQALLMRVYEARGIAKYINGDAQMQQWLQQHPEIK